MNLQRHRQNITAQLEGDIAVFTAHTRLQAKADAAFPFVQDSTFLYLTGINEPDWMVILDGEDAFLVAPHTSDTHKLFDGELSIDEARRLSGIETIIASDEAEVRLKDWAEEGRKVWALGEDPHASHYNFRLNPAQTELWQTLSSLFSEVKDCRGLVARARAIKDDDEIAAIERAIAVTIEGFTEVRDSLATTRHEYEVEATLNHAFRRTGAKGHAYDPIVAGGEHACTLHYGHNDDALPKNGLLLIDAGAKVDGYAADITRTYAVGTPTERQVAVHTAVENAHKEIIALLKPGLSVKAYHESVDDIMKAALASLDLLKTEADYRTYFPHAISHGLGLDVHDSLGGPETFQPGMILTVEPGIYIPEEGIGVRIEDDILITETGNRNLSAALATRL